MKKSLLDIQQEIRALDEKVKDISASIASISNEIEAFRATDDDSVDYEMIKRMSQNFSFGRHPVRGLEDPYACRLYIRNLLSIVQMDQGSGYNIDRLIFIQWILSQMDIENPLEDFVTDSLRMTSEIFGEIIETIPEEYRDYLVVDSMIVANICGAANENIFLYLANICSVWGIDKDWLGRLSLIAKGVLQNFENMEQAEWERIFKIAKMFEHYLDHDTLQKAYNDCRKLVVRLSDNNCFDFQWKCAQQARVEKGDVIATYRKCFSFLRAIADEEVIKIKAPCSGTLFRFRKNNINYGVIAHETANKDSIIAWAM